MIRKNQDGSSDEIGKNKISVRDLKIIQVLLEPRGSTINIVQYRKADTQKRTQHTG